MGIRRTKHAVYDIKYHLVGIPKYRKDVLRGEVGEYLKEVFQRIAEEYELPKYYRQRLELAQDIIKSLFAPEEIDRQQTRLGEFTEKEGN